MCASLCACDKTFRVNAQQIVCSSVTHFDLEIGEDLIHLHSVVLVSLACLVVRVEDLLKLLRGLALESQIKLEVLYPDFSQLCNH